MIDFHSHILPHMDDGSKSRRETFGLLSMLANQGIQTVIATPHFQADAEESVDAFLARREESFESVSERLPENAPRILLGAEVLYYPGIGRMTDLKKLCIQGTDILLLEMPMTRWTEYTVKELVELSGSGRVTLALAHIERYQGMQKADTFRRLYECGILMQVNASFFTAFSTKRKALSMLRRGEIQMIGSDCHNLAYRPPNIGEAYRIIEKKFGSEFLADFDEYNQTLLENN